MSASPMKGIWGMAVRPNTQYKAAVWAKGGDGFTGPLTLALVSTDGKTVYAQAQIDKISNKYEKHEATLTTAADVPETKDACFQIWAGSKGTVWLGFVSLFPPTFKNPRSASGYHAVDGRHERQISCASPAATTLKAAIMPAVSIGRKRSAPSRSARATRTPRGATGHRTDWVCWSSWNGAKTSGWHRGWAFTRAIRWAAATPSRPERR